MSLGTSLRINPSALAGLNRGYIPIQRHRGYVTNEFIKIKKEVLFFFIIRNL